MFEEINVELLEEGKTLVSENVSKMCKESEVNICCWCVTILSPGYLYVVLTNAACL